MAEEYKLFYSILEGDLDPELPINKDEYHIFHLSERNPIDKTINAKFNNIVDVNINILSSNSLIPNYYLSKIRSECNRLVDVYDNESFNSSDEAKFSQYITSQYRRVLLLMQKAHIKHQTFSIPFESRYSKLAAFDAEYNGKAIIRDVLYYFHEFLIALSLKIQEIYSQNIKSVQYKNEDEIIRLLYKEPGKIQSNKYDNINKNIVRTRRLIDTKPFDIQKIIGLLNEMIHTYITYSPHKYSISGDIDFDKAYINIIKALENSIFIDTHKIKGMLMYYNVLVSDSYNSSVLDGFKNNTKQNLLNFNNSIDAIDFIDTLQIKNSNYIVNSKVPAELKINSMPRLIDGWLLILKEHYQKNSSFRLPDQDVKPNETPSVQIKKFFSLDGKQIHSDIEIVDYVNDWLNCRVTLDQWLNFCDVNLDNILRDMCLSDKEQVKIYNHQFVLYNKFVIIIFNNRFKLFFDRVQSEEDKNIVATRDLKLIEDFINGDIDSFKAERLETSYGIKDWKRTALQFDNILKHRYISDDNHNIHSPDCYADAEAILKYKTFLSDYITKSSKQPNLTLEKNIQNLPANIGPDFHPSIVSFLNAADPYEKYKSNWSCSGYYYNLKRRFSELKPQFTLYITSIPQSDRQNVINAYISHVNNVTNQYVAGTGSNAAYFLNSLSISLTDFFEKPANEIPPNAFYKYIRDTYDAIDRKDGDYKILDLISAFIFNISDYFIDELMSFFRSLLVPENNHETTVSHENVSAPQAVSVKNFPDSLDIFFESADITSKYKSDCSCSSYYAVLRDKCKSVQADILNLYSSVLPQNKQSFIKSYLMKIEGAIKNYIGGNIGHALKYLKDNNFNFNEFFETEIFKNNASTDRLPGCLRLSYNDFYNKYFESSIYDLRTSFFHLISETFIDNLVFFIKNLPVNLDASDSVNTSTNKGNKSDLSGDTISGNYNFIKSDLSIDELKEIFPKLSKYIDISQTNVNNFLHVFNKDMPVVSTFEKINWCGEKLKLFAFIYAVSSYTNESKTKFVPNHVLKIIPDFFLIDKKKIKTLARPKKEEYKNIKIFTNIVSSVLSKKG